MDRARERHIRRGVVPRRRSNTHRVGGSVRAAVGRGDRRALPVLPQAQRQRQVRVRQTRGRRRRRERGERLRELREGRHDRVVGHERLAEDQGEFLGDRAGPGGGAGFGADGGGGTRARTPGGYGRRDGAGVWGAGGRATRGDQVPDQRRARGRRRRGVPGDDASAAAATDFLEQERVQERPGRRSAQRHVHRVRARRTGSGVRGRRRRAGQVVGREAAVARVGAVGDRGRGPAGARGR